MLCAVESAPPLAPAGAVVLKNKRSAGEGARVTSHSTKRLSAAINRKSRREGPGRLMYPPGYYATKPPPT